MPASDPGAISLAKAVLWEEAKGKLRAMVAAEGQQLPDYDGNYTVLNDSVEDFIKCLEDEALHE